MNDLFYITSLVIGDLFHDGHGMTSTVMIRSNLDYDQIMRAYETSSKQLGFNLIEKVAANHEDSMINRDQLQFLVDAGLDLKQMFDYDHEKVSLILTDETSEIYTLSIDNYRNIFLFVVKLGCPEFEYEIIQGQRLMIGGYGLFC